MKSPKKAGDSFVLIFTLLIAISSATVVARPEGEGVAMLIVRVAIPFFVILGLFKLMNSITRRGDEDKSK